MFQAALKTSSFFHRRVSREPLLIQQIGPLIFTEIFPEDF